MPVAQTGEVSPTAQKELAVNSPKEAETKASQNDNLIEIKSPMIGTFYRASSPDKPPFVKVGDHIEKGTVLCVIEAMKLFNEIESEVSGTIVKGYGENLPLIEPSCIFS
ncbi:UNVERIFIED_CONTAM: hypothetical protein GTU68_012084 [Idotea baltica]|nr:hypothetical protein [Idotea baltica]